MANLNSRDLAKFVGGQLEVQNRNEGYLYRGEIATVGIKGEDLVATLNWNARGEGYPPIPTRWVNDTEHLSYGANLSIYEVVQNDRERLTLSSGITGEITVLFAKGGSRLAPSKVEGLALN